MPAEPSTAADDDANPLWGPDWPEVRALWPLEPTVAHLNHGSYGAVPSPVLEEQASWRDRMETNPVRFFTRELPDALAQARAEVARFLGSTDEAIAFVRNATSAANAVLASLDLAAGDAVLLTDHAYGAVEIAARRWSVRAGAAVDRIHVPLDADAGDVVEAFLAAVHERTRLVVVDQVTSPTAHRLPLTELLPALRERGVPVLVDGAHAPGMLAVDLDHLGADYWFGNLHKWGFAPRGTAVLHAAPHHRARLRPLVASWGEGLDFPSSFDETGTDDVTPWLSAPRALRVLARLDLDRLRKHNVALATAGQLEVAAALGIDEESLPRDPAVSMQLVPLPDGLVTDDASAAALQARIGEEAAVEVAITNWAGRGFVRLSAQAYNAPADYRRLADDLPALL
jgi:isopenicillin-N epimerase